MTNESMEIPKYYGRLNDYFPAQEMKHPLHLRDLVEDQPNYHKIENSDYILLYAQFRDFIFIDYLLVNASKRGNGIGSRIMNYLYGKGLPIILEVEESDEDNPDTLLRRRFYIRHGFHFARGVKYLRIDKSGVPFSMDILYWPLGEFLSDEQVMLMMATVCKHVHNYKSERYYENLPADPNKVLSVVSVN